MDTTAREISPRPAAEEPLGTDRTLHPLICQTLFSMEMENIPTEIRPRASDAIDE